MTKSKRRRSEQLFPASAHVLGADRFSIDDAARILLGPEAFAGHHRVALYALLVATRFPTLKSSLDCYVAQALIRTPIRPSRSGASSVEPWAQRQQWGQSMISGNFSLEIASAAYPAHYLDYAHNNPDKIYEMRALLGRFVVTSILREPRLLQTGRAKRAFELDIMGGGRQFWRKGKNHDASGPRHTSFSAVWSADETLVLGRVLGLQPMPYTPPVDDEFNEELIEGADNPSWLPEQSPFSACLDRVLTGDDLGSIRSRLWFYRELVLRMGGSTSRRGVRAKWGSLLARENIWVGKPRQTKELSGSYIFSETQQEIIRKVLEK